MPQEKTYTIQIDENTTIELDERQLPDGFDTLHSDEQDLVARKVVSDHITLLQKAEEPATFRDFAYPIGFLIVFALIILWIAKKIRSNPKLYDNFVKADGDPNPEYGQGWRQNAAAAAVKPAYNTYYGNTLMLPNEDYTRILSKYSPFFNLLNASEKDIFISRLKKFIQKKIYFIHGDTGFREMPVLTSASAIQLSFGLNKYLLPGYPHIHIYPEEFIRTHPNICFLEGSVSGYSIYLSWKHFLKGNANISDGQHVGLHEMAHAYYCQNFHQETNIDKSFKRNFEYFHEHGKPVYSSEQMPGKDFYTDYALSDLHEFWAESVEIYFERTLEMKARFPSLYLAISNLLNQDHAKRISRQGEV